MGVDNHLRKLLKEELQQPRTWVARPEILLHPNIPKPLHQVNPRSILGSSWWDATRQAAYAYTDYHCIACEVHKTCAKGRQWLEGHEIYEIDYVKGRCVYLETVALCHFCHNYIHDGRMLMLLKIGKLHHAKYAAIIQHGDQVLAKAGLTRPSPLERDLIINKQKVAQWHRWRLVLNGKLYPPKFKNLEEWQRHHQALNDE